MERTGDASLQVGPEWCSQNARIMDIITRLPSCVNVTKYWTDFSESIQRLMDTKIWWAILILFRTCPLSP